ncbi:MAG: hypothetical protein ACLR3S_02315 [Clostridium fessum]
MAISFGSIPAYQRCDIGAIELIRNTLEKAKRQAPVSAGIGRAGGDYLPSDRIVVIHEGKITGEMRAMRRMRTIWVCL